MLQCKYIETMSQEDKQDLLKGLLITKRGYDHKDTDFTNYGLCSNVRWNGRGEFHLKKILFELFRSYHYPFNSDLGDVDYWEEEDKSTNPKRMKFLNELIEALEASIEQSRWR